MSIRSAERRRWSADLARPDVGPRAQLEAAYHLHQAGELAMQAPATIVASYAPQTLASLGTGTARIDVRVVAAGGAAAYRTALAAECARAARPGSSCWPTRGSPGRPRSGPTSPPAAWTRAC